MGLFDLFSSSPEKKIEKAKQVMLNEHHQAQVRQQAIYDLAQFNNELSAQALIERLTVNFRDTIKNEQERGWVRSVLVEQFNERAIEPLKASLQNASKKLAKTWVDSARSAAPHVLLMRHFDERFGSILGNSW